MLLKFLDECDIIIVSSGLPLYLEEKMEKKLYKSVKDKKISGVCGGISEYFNVDSTLIRLAWVIFGLCGGCGLLAYIIAAIVMPVNPEQGQ